MTLAISFVCLLIVAGIASAQDVSVDRYRRTEIDPVNLAAEINAIISNVQQADSTLSTVREAIPDLASKGRFDAMSNQVSALREIAEDRAFADEAAGLSNLVANMKITADATASVGAATADLFPGMESSISTANGYATDMFVGNLEQNRKALELSTRLASDLRPAIDGLESVNSAFGEFGASSRSLFESIETMASLSEESVVDLNTFLAHFANTRFANSNLPIFRYAQWSTYNQNCCWYWDNRNDLNGAVAPSTWGDSNGRAYQMTTNVAYMRTLYNKRVYCGWTCAVFNKEWYSYSSTNSMQGSVLMRIRNTTPSSVSWSMTYYYTSYGGWNEYASISFNGANTWSTSSNCGRCTRSQSFSFPANRVSTVIVVSSSSAQSGTRTMHMSFINNSLKLPAGLEWVDDLDYISSL
eukprot:m.184628 g.184628  ORF g.184628 m.184628 type:complete len:413 (-) comp13599_c0_seq3:174-1412(-)